MMWSFNEIEDISPLSCVDIISSGFNVVDTLRDIEKSLYFIAFGFIVGTDIVS